MGPLNHPPIVADVADLEGNAQSGVAYTNTAAQSSALADGVYDIWSDQDCYIKIGPTADDVTTGSGYLLRKDLTMTVFVRKNSKLGAIRAGASNGTLFFHKVG